jgi:hypothetical protein
MSNLPKIESSNGIAPGQQNQHGQQQVELLLHGEGPEHQEWASGRREVIARVGEMPENEVVNLGHAQHAQDQQDRIVGRHQPNRAADVDPADDFARRGLLQSEQQVARDQEATQDEEQLDS